jgi:hypothetical protein
MKALKWIVLATYLGSISGSASEEAGVSIFTPLVSDKVLIEPQRDSGGRLQLKISGDRYDGRRLIKALMSELSSGRANDELSNVDLDLEVESLIGFGEEILPSVSLRLSTSAGILRELRLNSGPDKRLVAELRTSPDRKTIDLTAADAGALFRVLDLYANIARGQLSLTIDITDLGWKGLMTMRDYAVSYEPFFRELGGNGLVEFSIMRMTFGSDSGRVVIDHGYACSPILLAEMRGRWT